MITLRELFTVMWTITRVEVWARREDGQLLHRFWIGEDCDREHLPPGMISDWTHDKLTLAPRKINEHGELVRGNIEMGWGFKKGTIPKEILDAEVTHLRVHNVGPHESKTVDIDVVMPEMHIEILKKELSE